MKLFLVYREPELGESWNAYFGDEPDVDVVQGDITSWNCDAAVSPANSFGFMDGGLDWTLSERFGWDLQQRLQERIAELPEGELLVGRTLVLETNDDRIPYLISAPTMRVPMNFQIPRSINAYLAMKGILLAAKQHERINSLAVPGLCTGVGRMPGPIAAKQMHAAYQEIMHGQRQQFADFGEAQKRQLELNPESMIYVD